MTEIWKPIPGFEDCYQISISNRGNVKSLSRIVEGGYSGPRRIPERIRKPNRHPGGKLWIQLHADGRRVDHRVDRLFAQAFPETTR